jgi:hypothetical protein
MRKGPIIIIIGVLLALISIPMLFAYTLFDERTVSRWEFEEDHESEEEVVYTYTFEDLDPGRIVVKSRGIFFDVENIHVEIINEGKGDTIEEYDLTPGYLFWEEEDTVLEKRGDYLIRITVDESTGGAPDFQVEYTAQYSQLGLIIAVMGFPTFLIAGAAGIIWGSSKIYRQRKGFDKGPKVEFDAKYEGVPTFHDEKKEEWEEYETSPRRKELWYEPATNPYDDVPADYYSRKAAEAKAFNRKWHQRWGDDLEGGISERVSKGKGKLRKKGK